MLNRLSSAPRCRENAAYAPSRRNWGGVWWLAATGLAGGPPAVAAAPMQVVSAVPYQADSGSVAVQCGKLIDGVAAQAQDLATVIIRNGRVESVQPGAMSPNGMPVVDLKQYTCLPGLIDMHTHLTDSGHETSDLSVYYKRTKAEQGAIARESARSTLLAGFTGARDVGTYIAWVDRDLRDAINQGNAVGPRMQVAGYYLTIPAGGGDLVIPGHAESEIPPQVRMGVARGPEQFRQKAEQAVAGGADLLKVIASGAVLAFGGVPGEREMMPEEIKAVVDVAHAHGIKVAAHAHGAQSIKDAILAGADTIEHASLIDDEGIRLAQEHGTGLSMDVYNGDWIDTVGRAEKWPEEFLRKNVETTEAQRQGFTKAHAAGVDIVYGTDAAVYPHGLNARQFPIMVQRGMTPMEAIQSATSLAARHMGWDDRIGSLQPGRFGDLIAVKGDPLADITRLQDVAVVLKGGLAFKLPAE
ncbi:MAG: amidohydrolase family protein [Proteobacteria bacterium]|nr:amidohydrolase family protein [Pseudomonadota bacterium]